MHLLLSNLLQLFSVCNQHVLSNPTVCNVVSVLYVLELMHVFSASVHHRLKLQSIKVSKTNLCDLCTSIRILKKKKKISEANIKDQQHPQS